MADGDASARRDAALTGVVLGGVASAAFLVGAPVTPTALAAGAVATVAAELLLSLRSAWVRAVWGRRAVQATAVVVGLVRPDVPQVAVVHDVQVTGAALIGCDR